MVSEVFSCYCADTDDCICGDTCECVDCGCSKCEGVVMECACGGNCACGAADGEDDDGEVNVLNELGGG